MTERNLSAALSAAISAGTVYPAILYEGEFVAAGSPSEVPAYLRLWTGIGDLSWDSKTWTGAGNLLSITPLTETQQIRANGFTVALSGMNTAIVAAALNNVRQGRQGTLWLAAMDANGALLGTPYQLQGGRLDFTVLDSNGARCDVAVQYEGRLIDLERPRRRRYTAEDQKIDYPSDLGFDYVPSLQQKEVLWGGSSGG